MIRFRSRKDMIRNVLYLEPHLAFDEVSAILKKASRKQIRVFLVSFRAKHISQFQTST